LLLSLTWGDYQAQNAICSRADFYLGVLFIIPATRTQYSITIQSWAVLLFFIALHCVEYSYIHL